MSSWRQLCSCGPLLALFTISLISVTAIYADLMWWPASTWGGLIHLLVFLGFVTAVLTNYFKAALLGPGFVPSGWRPARSKDEKFLQFCSVCRAFKAPRAHHCRKCDRCVLKMDHHCPWIGTCTGHRNQTNFILFLFMAPVGCIHAIVILVAAMYRALNLHYYVYYGVEAPLVQLGVKSFVVCMFATGLAIGVVIAVGMLFVMEIKSVLRNRTGIEDWIVEKANERLAQLDRRDDHDDDKEDDAPETAPPVFRFPYDLGWRRNLAEVINWDWTARGDGLHWPLAPDCHQYDLTKEQLAQKTEKRQRTVVYRVVTSYGGTFFPISYGCRVIWGLPCTDEPRVAVEFGDVVHVTRWKRHWLYGVKADKTGAVGKTSARLRGGGEGPVLEPERGWFPRRCVAEACDGGANGEKKAR